MHSIIEWVKEHPLESGALGLVGIVAVYLLLHSTSSSAAPAASSSSTDAADYYQAQLQATQLAAQQTAQTQATQSQNYQANLTATVQNNEVAAQLAALQDQDSSAIQAAQIQANSNTLQTQLEADVATTNISAQQDVANKQTEAQVQIAEGAYTVQNTAENDQLAAITNQIQGQVQQQQIAAQVQNTTTAAQVSENHDNLATVLGLVTSQNAVQEDEYDDQLKQQQTNDATAVALSGQQYDYLTGEADDATAINLTALGDQTQIESQAATEQYNLSTQTLGIVQQAGLNHGTESLENSLAQITESALGNPGGAVQATANSTAQVSSNYSTSPASIIASITKGATGILTGLFS